MRYIKEFEGLRGLMALWVVIGHWATSIPLSFAPLHQKLYNAYAVDVFIMLSGFAIFSLLENKHENYGPYIIRRFFRIYPIYLLYLVLSILTLSIAREAFLNGPPAFMQDRRVDIIDSATNHFWPHLIAHLTLLHGMVPEHILPDTNWAFLGQAWSLSLEWQFYVVAPLLLFFVHRGRSPLTLLLLLIGTLLLVAASHFFWSAFLGSKLHLFAIGIATCYLIRYLSSIEAFDYRKVRPFVVLAFCFMVFFKTTALPFMIWLVAVYLAVAAQKSTDPLAASTSRIMKTAPLQWLGHISYSAYLSHGLLIVAGLRLLENYPGLSRYGFSIALFLIVVPGTIAVSSISYLLVEKPFMQAAKVWADRLSRRQLAGGPAEPAIPRTGGV
jgi:peptidoglycan/LPS O-acetylase OafA/YrhL